MNYVKTFLTTEYTEYTEKILNYANAYLVPTLCVTSEGMQSVRAGGSLRRA